MSDPRPNETWTSSTTQPITATWTYHYPRKWRVNWHRVDDLSHRLPLPRRVQRIICDRFEVYVGIPAADLVRMDYAGHCPWWLKDLL
jgi:hypothetical protein